MHGSSDELTRNYLDKFAICWQHIGGCEATTETEFFGHKLTTPIMSGGMAHYHRLREGGAVEFAQGVRDAGTVMWTGFCPDEEMEKIIDVGAPAVRIIKPFADENLVLKHIEHDAKAGAAAFSMDIDHVFDKKGRIGEFFGHPFVPQTVELAEAADALVGIVFKGQIVIKEDQIRMHGGNGLDMRFHVLQKVLVQWAAAVGAAAFVAKTVGQPGERLVFHDPQTPEPDGGLHAGFLDFDDGVTQDAIDPVHIHFVGA